MNRYAPEPATVAEQRRYAQRLIADLDALEKERNLVVYELDARMVARWLLLAHDFIEPIFPNATFIPSPAGVESRPQGLTG